MKIRVVKTASGAKAVQVIRYQNNKRIIVRHIGSAHTQEELDELMIVAEDLVKQFSSQLSLSPKKPVFFFIFSTPPLFPPLNLVFSNPKNEGNFR